MSATRREKLESEYNTLVFARSIMVQRHVLAESERNSDAMTTCIGVLTCEIAITGRDLEESRKLKP